jgi:hypothetical protein
MFVRWLNAIEDFLFDVTRLPGSRNPTDLLSRRGFADGDGPAPSTGDDEELFSRLGRDTPASALLDAVRHGPGHNSLRPGLVSSARQGRNS